MADDVGPEQVELEVLDENTRQIKEYHEAMHKLFLGSDDVTVARSVASFMGCVMVHTDTRGLIGGFVNEILQYAHLASVVQDERANNPKGAAQ